MSEKNGEEGLISGEPIEKGSVIEANLEEKESPEARRERLKREEEKRKHLAWINSEEYWWLISRRDREG